MGNAEEYGEKGGNFEQNGRLQMDATVLEVQKLEETDLESDKEYGTQ